MQSFLAVLGGFATMAVLVIITTAIAAQVLIPGGMQATRSPTAPLPPAYLAANLAASALAAALGGAVTARIAPGHPIYHALALAALMVVMGVLSARQAGDRQPRWYQLVLLTAMPAVAVAGAYILVGLTGAD